MDFRFVQAARRLRRLPSVDPHEPPLLRLVPLVALAVVQVLGTVLAARGQPDRTPLDLLAIALLIAGPAALAFRRRYPAAVAAAVVTVTLGYLLLGYPFGPVVISVVIALFNAVLSGHRLAAWLAGSGLYVGHFGLRMALHVEGPTTLAQLLGVAAWLLVVLIGSEFARARHAQAAEAARTQEEQARRMQSEERLRIARDVHDVVAHSISLINVQANVALHLIDEHPDQARAALSVIRETSKAALGDVGTILSTLRGADEPAPYAPAPGLSRLGELVAHAALSGVAVYVSQEGEAHLLPPQVDVAAFHVVQEALTNVSRHAHATEAKVDVHYTDDRLTVRVTDNGKASSASVQPGYGIRGMQERVGALGGTLGAEARPGGGFAVTAILPLHDLT